MCDHTEDWRRTATPDSSGRRNPLSAKEIGMSILKIDVPLCHIVTPSSVGDVPEQSRRVSGADKGGHFEERPALNGRRRHRGSSGGHGHGELSEKGLAWIGLPNYATDRVRLESLACGIPPV